MDCKSLMVGDLVYIHEPECKGHRVDYINELDGQVGADGEVYDEDDIRPIPITEDILLKLGFSKEYSEREIEYDLIDFPFTIVFDRYKKEWYAGTYMCGRESDWIERQFDCQFLYQLQHLMGQCGIDKNIEL